MFSRIIAFEFGFQRRQISFYVTFIVFFLLVFFTVVSDNVTIGSSGNWHRNGPFAIAQNLGIMSVFGIFFMATFLSRVTLRDLEFKTAELIYTTGISRTGYLLGRFIGAFGAAFLAFMSVPLAVLVGSFMPWIDPETVGPLNLMHYLHPIVFLVLPNLFFIGAVFFAIAALTRSTLVTYGSIVGILVLYFVTGQVFSGPEDLTIGSLLDPFGFRAFAEVTRYWTTFERDTALFNIEGNFLLNRMIWTGLGLALIAVTMVFFRFETVSRKAGRKKEKAEASEADDIATASLPGWVSHKPVFDRTTPFSQFLARLALEVGGVVKNTGFIVILALGIFNTLNALANTAFLGTEVFPVTRLMLQFINGSFSFVILIVVIYFTAELVWRDRGLGMQEIVDATPAPNWAFVISKLTAMFVVVLGLLAVSGITAVGVQLFQGYTDIEISLYMRRLFLHFALPFYMISVLSIFVQVLANNKYLGMLVMVVYLISTITLTNFGFDHNLYQFATRPQAPLSDMNGYGHFMDIAFWYNLYWAFFSVILAVVAYTLWNRGTLQSLRVRVKNFRANFSPAAGVIAGLAFVGFVSTGAYIFYNTNILNEYRTRDDLERDQIAYEEKYIQYENMPQPRIVDVYADVDIYPYQHRYTVSGRYVIENRTDAPISSIHLGFGLDTIINTVSIEGASLSEQDDEFAYYIFDFDQPMAPGEQRTVSFETMREDRGFKNSNNVTTINFNGTFFNNNEAMPYLAFTRAGVLTDPKTRRKYDLEPVDRQPKLEDIAARRNSYLRSDSDWVNFETIVSTTPGQIAIAPGYLQEEWIEDNRRYFHYKMDAPIQNFFSYLSAEYSENKGKWNDVDISVYYYQPHAYNVDRMVYAVERSLDYYSANFSPYQYRQMRILEFPGYQNFAQSFPNTVPYSESIGFIADLSDPENIDGVFYVTAHEVAHQWWAHQVMGANVQGGTVLVETLAQYSALMVMEKEYGPNMMRKFLKFELDNYLRNRGNELIEELPLYRVENQPYIHYRKGSLVMYALKDYVGEDVVDRALANLIAEKAYAYDPYTTSLDLLRHIRAEAGPDYDTLITDLFEKITLWDLKVTEATYNERTDGRFDVRMTIDAAKFEADGQGKEEARELDMMIDVGIFKAHPKDFGKDTDDVLYLEKRRIKSGETVLEFTLDKKPEYVGIDPYNKLIDRDSNDNLSSLTEAPETAS